MSVGRKSLEAVDHRSRTAAERRARMRDHLLRSALELVAEQGMSSNLIDALIRSASVSRGTFYNYFSSVEELLEAVSASTSQALVSRVDRALQAIENPAARVSCGIRLCLQAGAEDPVLAAFISRGGPVALQQNHVLATALCRDLAAGIEAGQFANQSLELAYDLVVGPVLAAYHRMSLGNIGSDYIDDIACAALVALGLTRATARRLSTQELPVLPPEASIHLADQSATNSSKRKKK